MRQEDNSIITLCPSIGQFFINELPLLLLCVAMLLIGGLPGCAYSTLLLVFSLLFSLCLLYRFIYLRSIRYHIGSEQLICEHGVFQRSVNYMELYRVVDFDTTVMRTEKRDRVVDGQDDSKVGNDRHQEQL